MWITLLPPLALAAILSSALHAESFQGIKGPPQTAHSKRVIDANRPLRPSFVDRALSSTAEPADTPEASSGNVSIVYCTGCRWMLRAVYFAQELLTTFQDDLSSVTLVPSRPPAPGGTFVVTLDGHPVWNREVEGGFPETKQLKRRIRDIVAPNRDLGHIDASGEEKEAASVMPSTPEEKSEGEAGCNECPDEGGPSSHSIVFAAGNDVGSMISPHVSITYCTGCKWMFRAAWYAQELLSTFQDDLNSVSLVPSRDVTGTFTVTLDDTHLIWDRKSEGGHAEAKELKQRIRDIIAPSRDLGHVDAGHEASDAGNQPVEEMSDEEAREQQKFFGVM